MNIENFLAISEELPNTLTFPHYEELMMLVQEHFEAEYGWDKEEFHEFYPSDEYVEEIDLYQTELPNIPFVNVSATLNISTCTITQTLSGRNIPTLQYERTFEDYPALIHYINVSEGLDFITFPRSQDEKIRQTLLRAIQAQHNVSTFEEGLHALGYKL